MRSPADAFYVSRRNAFEPYGLPDTGGARIPHRVRLKLPVLFAARLGELMRIIVRHHRNGLLFCILQGKRDVCPERCVPALVARDEASVQPHARVIIDRAEVKQDALTFGRYFELALVPACEVVAAVADAARVRFRREGHLD